MVVAAIVFFLVCVGYVSLCDRIIGRDDSGAAPSTPDQHERAVR